MTSHDTTDFLMLLEREAEEAMTAWGWDAQCPQETPFNFGETLAFTKMTSSVSAGATVLPNVMSGVGFQVGNTIDLSKGTPQYETNVISGFGSIILQFPLLFNHSAGATVSVPVPTTTTTTTTSTSTTSTTTSTTTTVTTSTSTTSTVTFTTWNPIVTPSVVVVTRTVEEEGNGALVAVAAIGSLTAAGLLAMVFFVLYSKGHFSAKKADPDMVSSPMSQSPSKSPKVSNPLRDAGAPAPSAWEGDRASPAAARKNLNEEQEHQSADINEEVLINEEELTPSTPTYACTSPYAVHPADAAEIAELSEEEV